MKDIIPRNINDVSQKAMMDMLNGKKLSLFGIELPKAVASLNTEIQNVSINSHSADFVYLLEDDTLLHIEFQTDFDENDVMRFLAYVANLLAKHKKRRAITIVIFAAGVKRRDFETVSATLNFKPHAIFLDEMDGDAILTKLEAKIRQKIPLNHEEINQLLFTSFMKSATISVEEKVTRQLNIAKTIKASRQREIAIASIYGVASKFLDDDVMKNLSEVFVKMDPFAKIVERMAKAEVEKAERATARAEKAIERAEKAMKLVAKNKLETAKRLIKEGINLELIAKATDLSLETVQGLQA